MANGGTSHYVYYGCNRSKDLNCKCGYLREEELIKQLVELIDKIEIEEKFIQNKFDQEESRMVVFQKQFYGVKQPKSKIEYDSRKYIEHILTEGTLKEKREMLGNLRNKLVLKNKKVTLED